VSLDNTTVTDQVVPIDGYPVPREEWNWCGQDDPDAEAGEHGAEVLLRRDRRAGDHRQDPTGSQPTVPPASRPRRGI
jgi:hypothetical protein